MEGRLYKQKKNGEKKWFEFRTKNIFQTYQIANHNILNSIV